MLNGFVHESIEVSPLFLIVMPSYEIAGICVELRSYSVIRRSERSEFPNGALEEGGTTSSKIGTRLDKTI